MDEIFDFTDPGIGDANIEPVERACGLNCAVDIRRNGYVTLHPREPRIGRAGFHCAIKCNNLGTLAQISLNGGPADTISSTGHDGNFVLKNAHLEISFLH
ncbi:hypothetical protein SAMCFNEI73_pC1563 (plasmid) [Sinorhizobium americanum]|uniref:Uncharacterized protein n=1 Tax=Sinorhizobium americanum TaxID=194963 RepID=A0A1L3LYT1_9HYPH|nr:hypothetical protein SAMCFNEI73_pC1563 [Sinorhizobium americanum]